MAKEKTKADIQTLLDAALAEIAQLKENPEALKAAIESDKVKALEAKVNELETAISSDNSKALAEELKTENESLKQENTALTEKLKEKASALSSFTHEIEGTYKAQNGNVYKIRTGHKKFTMDKKEYKSEDVINDATVMEILIAERSGIIEIVQPEK